MDGDKGVEILEQQQVNQKIFYYTSQLIDKFGEVFPKGPEQETFEALAAFTSVVLAKYAEALGEEYEVTLKDFTELLVAYKE